MKRNEQKMGTKIQQLWCVEETVSLYYVSAALEDQLLIELLLVNVP